MALLVAVIRATYFFLGQPRAAFRPDERGQRRNGQQHSARKRPRRALQTNRGGQVKALRPAASAMYTDSDDEPRSPPRDTDTDDSSDDESPQTGANVWRAGTYGKVVAELDGGDVKVQWEGGDTSTLDAEVCEAALRSYARSPRAQGANDARRASTSSSSSEEDDADRQLLVGDELLSKCGSLVGRIIDISDEGVVMAEWSEPARSARRAEPRSSRAAARAKVCYAHDNDIDEPTALSMDDARALRKLWREKQRGGAVHVASSQECDAEAASLDDDDDESEKHPWSDSSQSSQEDGGDAPENEQPPRPPPPPRMRSAPSEASEPTPPSAAVDDESSDEDDAPPARPLAAARPAAPSAAPRASPTRPRPPATRPRPPAAPRASVRRAATSGGDSDDDDSDSEESDDEDDPNREEIVLSSQPGPEPEPVRGDSSQEPESQGEVPPEPYSQQGPSGVQVRSFDAAALWDRISKATPPPRLRLAPPPVEVLDSADPRWWQILEAAKWKNDEVRRGLDKVQFAGDRSGLDCRHLPPLAVLRDQGFKALVVDELAAKDFQKHLKGTYYDSDTLIHCYGFEVTSYSWVGLYKGVDGAPPEIVAVVANGTSVTREAFVARAHEGVHRARDAVTGGLEYLNRAKRGNVSNHGDMVLVGARKPRFRKGKQKRKRDGDVGLYKHDPRAKDDRSYLVGVCFIATLLSILEKFYAPERYAARVLMSEALNIPPISQSIPRSLAAMATMAMSSGYACKLHTDKSGKTINETIVWPPLANPPTDWRFAIACFGRLVDLTGSDGVFVTLSGYRTVHGTVVSTKRPDHRGMGFAAVLKENLINVAVRDALALGPKKKSRDSEEG